MRPFIFSPWSMAASRPSRPAVVAGEETYTFAELVDDADRLGAALLSRGVPDGAVISTDIPAGPGFFALALAALRYGFGLFPVNPADLMGVGAPLLEQAEVLWHVSDQELSIGIGPTVLFSDLLETSGRTSGRGAPTSAPTASRGGYLVFATSGTTGRPTVVRRARPWYPYKGVCVLAKYEAGPESGPHIMANPSFHLGTLGPALYALQAGSTVVVQRNWSADEFRDLVGRHRAASAFLSPDLLVDLVTADRSPGPSLKVVFHGGSPCAPAVKRAAIDLLGPVLHEYYGTSAGLISEISAGEWLRNPGSVGRPMSGVRLRIEADGVERPPGHPGEVCVRLRAIDRRRGEDGPRGDFVRTGDLGLVGPDGYLYLHGRVSDGGTSVLTRLENELRSLPGVSDAVVLAAKNEPARPCAVCLVESLPGAPPDLGDRISRVADDFGVAVERLALRAPGFFPRTPSGKIRRWAEAASPEGS